MHEVIKIDEVTITQEATRTPKLIVSWNYVQYCTPKSSYGINHFYLTSTGHCTFYQRDPD
jgi:hypothetical protein